ncbi:Rrf2 family transcriptional regulator [Sphingobium yanoikuyae]|uniref:Rrf2 family transcriptional regulator n=1 Tax=Sphingobium yanoikuyae TaxID=13690 RepID=UPI0008479F85|nr:Rrf2 family transcriptional regulator [Sphingobium yanoikuyae]MDG2511932.1 Rrf2 family transcriptional regulator [Sphingobium yanoikuyae]
MQLTRHTDYALRVLIHLAAVPGGRATIPEIADAYGLSRNHLMKVVHGLGQGGFIRTQRGRGGGFTLAADPVDIRIGAVVRHSESDMAMADCASCAIRPACGLSGILAQAVGAFLTVLDGYSLADAARDRTALAALIAALPSPAAADPNPDLSPACASSSSPRPD